MKKEKKLKASCEEIKVKTEIEHSLTDNLPILATNWNKGERLSTIENFKISPLLDVKVTTTNDLQEIERRMNNIKSRLGDIVKNENRDEYSSPQGKFLLCTCAL